ncbi:MAG: ATP-binding protein, partial [Sphingomonadaceae bacterium]
LARNIALLVLTLLFAQILTLGLLAAFLVLPQTERLSSMMARNVAAISVTLDHVPDAERERLIKQLNAGEAIRVLPGSITPPEDRGVPTALERLFVYSFAEQMRDYGVVVWRGGLTGQLWVRLNLGGKPYWISYERPTGLTPTRGILISIAIALMISVIAGVLLQRRLGRPLQQLAGAADAIGQSGSSKPLAEDGPAEIAAVARSFNLMGKRLAAQDQDRTFMLAGISHDLRTPLAKIRLALAMLPAGDKEIEATLARQLDRVDVMLAQFLDFARGVDDEPAEPRSIRSIVTAAVALVEADTPIDIIASDTDQVAMMRPIALERAIINLLRNALTYGAPPVSVSVAPQGDAVTIAVRDHGAGAPEAMLERLDEPFFRADGARLNNGSTGLGLAIVRRIVARHYGSVTLRNHPDGGFEALIRLPQLIGPDPNYNRPSASSA